MTETTIGEAAAQVGVSVRTLHHWEYLGLLADGTVDTTAALERRRDHLTADLARTERALNAVDRALDTITSGAVLTAQEQRDVLGPHWNPDRAQQAAQRWGHTPQWRQHAERAAERTPTTGRP